MYEILLSSAHPERESVRSGKIEDDDDGYGFKA